ncbi:methylthioribose-1-phosphate isomerase-like protein, partial [Euroglyphus maynei]
QKAEYLCKSRPTAVNIRKEFDELLNFIQQQQQQNLSFDLLIDSIRKYCHGIMEKDRMINRKIGEYGCEHIRKNSNEKSRFNVLTHCNTGSLATAGYGTALGVIRQLHAKGLLERAYCTETRPYNQGSRLTAWELLTDNIPSTLICDNMVASLMASTKIDAIIVGADRVVANGDTANKIGTFQIAILAKYFSIPFYVASPMSTIDSSINDGSKIPIE